MKCWHYYVSVNLHVITLHLTICFHILPIFEDKLKKPERPTIKSGLKLRSEKSVDFRPIQYSVIYDFHASKVNLCSQINLSKIFFQYGGSCLSVAEGEIVTADENGTDEDGWIAVRKNDKRGKVPKSYLQPHGIMNV